MAGTSLIGNLAVLLSMDTAAFEKGSSQASKLLRKTQRDIEGLAKKINGFGQALSIGVTAPLVGFGTVAVREATEAAKAMGQVEAALKSMGPVAGKTSAELKKAADAFETQSLFEADEILTKVTANLLTFGNVAGKEFDRAQQAAINMSARLGQDLQSSAIQVGKALNDPIKGMTALQRVGVQFTAQQKEQIKALVETGQAAKAQGVILTELERQFSGAAAAAQETDPFNKMTDAFKQMAEQVGVALIPAIKPLTEAIVSIANAFTSLSPVAQKWVIIGAAVAAAFGPIAIGVSGLISAFGLLLPLLVKLGPAFAALRVAMLAAFANPVILGAAVLITGIYLAWKNWDKISAIVGNMVNAVKSHLSRLTGILNAVLNPVRTVQNAFATLYDKVVGNSYVPDMVDGIAAQMARLDEVLVAPTVAAASKAAEAFRNLQSEVSGLLNRLFPEAAALNRFKAEVNLLEQAMRQGIITAEQYADALSRLQTEGLTDEAISVLEQGSLVPSNDNVIDDIAGSLEQIPEKASQANDALLDIARGGINHLADGLTAVIMGTAKLGDVFRAVAAQILADLLRMQIQKVIMGALSSVLGVPGGMSFGGARAMGGPVAKGKTYLVGEDGPELFTADRSGRIVANNDLRPAMSGMGGMSMTFHNDFRGADPAAVGAIQARLNRMEAELPGRVVQAYQDAKSRFVIRD